MSLFLYLEQFDCRFPGSGGVWVLRRQRDYLVVFEHTKNRKYATLYEVAATLMAAVILLLFLFGFVVRPVSVSGRSMNPTLASGDWLLISQSTAFPERGDIVVVSDTAEVHEPIIKRVIAVAGDTIDIDYDAGAVYVNGEQISEPYILNEMRKPLNSSLLKLPLTVPEGCVFVMGDNRNISLDSRFSDIGIIDVREIQGRAVGRIFPVGSWSIY